MADIKRPVAGFAEARIEQPPHCENCSRLEAALADKNARLNDPYWLIRRGLLLLSRLPGPLLILIAGILVLALLAAAPPINRALVDAWHALTQAPAPRAMTESEPPAAVPAHAPPISSLAPLPSSSPSISPSPKAPVPIAVLAPSRSPFPSPSPTASPQHPCDVTHGNPPACRPSP